MFNRDPKLRHEGQEIFMDDKLMLEWHRCRKDIIYFAEKYFHIVDPDKGRVKIQLYEYQKRMLKAFVGDDEEKKRHSVCLSSRQIGKTTISTIYMVWYAIFSEDKTVAVLANKEKTAIEIVRRIQLAYGELPLWLQQGIKEKNKGSMTLENGTRIISGSTASSGIRGETINLLFLDEFAFVPSNVADDFMTSVYPTISKSEKSKIIIVSTPNGLNHFYHIYKDAVNGKNNFKPIKVNWDEVPGRDEEWKEEVIRDIGMIKWNQEFAARFIGSSTTLIDSALLERLGNKACEPESLSMGDYLHIFERPQADAFYILGVDTSKGIGSDYSVVQVLKINDEHDIEHVAKYRNNMVNPYDFAQVVISISDYYNKAYIMAENNDVGAQLCDYIWWDYENEQLLNCQKDGLGVHSNKKTKLAAHMLMKRYFENGWLTTKDVRTIFELSVYEEVRPDIFKASGNDHDDCVTSLFWALYFITTTFFDGKKLNVKNIDPKFKIDTQAIEEQQPVIVEDTQKIDENGFNWGDMGSEDDFFM